MRIIKNKFTYVVPTKCGSGIKDGGVGGNAKCLALLKIWSIESAIEIRCRSDAQFFCFPFSLDY
jgi:hypothetical protein